MADKGWIKTYRKIQDCWIWLDKEPFDKRSAWIDLLLTANHADKKILFNGELITIERGQILTSIRQLADKWKWSYDKVLRFLRLIESDGMIKKESDNFRTLLTIENYELYQDVPNADRTPISEQTSEPSSEQASEQTSERTSERVSDKQELKNNKNDKELKNVKNDKNIYPPISPQGEEELEKPKRTKFVPPTYDEVDAYCVERNNDIDAQEFIDFYQSKGWMVGKNKMKDWKAAIRTWERGRQKKATDKPKRQGVKWE